MIPPHVDHVVSLILEGIRPSSRGIFRRMGNAFSVWSLQMMLVLHVDVVASQIAGGWSAVLVRVEHDVTSG